MRTRGGVGKCMAHSRRGGGLRRMLYNLADFIRSPRYHYFGWANTSAPGYDTRFCRGRASSIACMYSANFSIPMKKNPYYRDDLINFAVLRRVTSDVYTRHGLRAHRNTLYVHLRVGDVLDDAPQPLSTFLHSVTKYHNHVVYVKPMSFYEHRRKVLERSFPRVRNVTLIYQRAGAKSRGYVAEVARVFRNYTVRTFCSDDVDKTFALMSHSPLFLGSGGGFSFLSSTLVLLNHGALLK